MLYVGTFEREVALRIAKGLRSAGHAARVSVRNTKALQTHRVWIEGRKQRDAELIERAGRECDAVRDYNHNKGNTERGDAAHACGLRVRGVLDEEFKG